MKKNLRLIMSSICLVLLFLVHLITDENTQRVIYVLIILISLSASIQGYINRVNIKDKRMARDSIIAPLAVMVVSIFMWLSN